MKCQVLQKEMRKMRLLGGSVGLRFMFLEASAFLKGLRTTQGRDKGTKG